MPEIKDANASIPTWSRDKVSLYRPEVLEAFQSGRYGGISLGQPISIWVITVLACVIGTSILLYAALGTMAKRSRVAGIAMPVTGTVTISATTGGTLMETFVQEGQRVKAGTALFAVSTERQGNSGELSELVATHLAERRNAIEVGESIRLHQERRRTDTVAQRIEKSRAELLNIEEDIKLAQARHKLAEESLDRYVSLEKNGFVAPTQTQAKHEDLLELASRINGLKRAKVQVESVILALTSEKADLEDNLRDIAAQTRNTVATLKQEMVENRARGRFLIVAPQDGTIATTFSKTGQAVAANQVLASLILAGRNKDEEERIEAHLYAPSRTSGFLVPGQKVNVRFHAFPYQKFGLTEAVIVDVSRTPIAPNELPPNIASTILSNAQQSIMGSNSSEALYRVRLKLARQSFQVYGRKYDVRPGMTLDADVLQENRRIWEWIVDPLLSI